MRPDRLHVAVRPRSILECLDFAVFFCGRRPLGVAAAALVGMLPCFLLNRWLLSRATEPGQTVLVALVAPLLEAPWATAPLTLYLGQAVFSDRFSWRAAARGFAVALPGMLLLQTILRGLLVATVLLSIFVFFSMFHLNPILLLEQPSLRRVWGRLNAMNARSTGRIIAVVTLQGIVLWLGMTFGTRAIATVAAVWSGARPAGGAWFDPAFDPVFDPETVVGATVVPATVEAAFWATLALLTVFRFFIYLDERIRREGWDVELKLRAAGTYAGLGTAPGGTAGGVPAAAGGVRRVAGAIVLAIACSAAGPGAMIAAAGATPAAEASASESPAAEPAAAGGGSARKALERQRFPWYDARRDAFRAATSPPRRVPEIDFGGPEARPAEPRGAGLGTVVIVGLIAAAVATAIWLVVRYGLPDLPAAAEPAKRTAVVLAAEQLAELPAATRGHDGDLLARAEALHAAGDDAGAIVFFHAWQLVELHGRGTLELARGKTTRRYVAEVARAEPALADLFRRSSRLFEDAFFGGLPVAREDFLAVWNRRREIAVPVGGNG